jgi:serine/threonine protein kinase
MIDSIGRVLVTDFGLAKSKKWSKITSDSMIVGTPVYMSPEQAQGKEVDVRSDIYSMGIVLYEMVTGEVPFYAEEPIAILKKVIDEKPRPPRQINSDIPRNIETIILKCIEKDPQKRYQTAGVFLRDLELSKMNLPLMANRSEITIFSDKGRRNIFKLLLALILSLAVSGVCLLTYNVNKGYIKQFNMSVFRPNLKELFGRHWSGDETNRLSKEIPAAILEDLADIVYLRNGTKVMGIIETADKKSVTVKLKIGTVTYPNHEILNIKYSAPDKKQQLLELWGKR